MHSRDWRIRTLKKAQETNTNISIYTENHAFSGWVNAVRAGLIPNPYVIIRVDSNRIVTLNIENIVAITHLDVM